MDTQTPKKSTNRLDKYLDEQGRVTHLPGKRSISDVAVICEYLATKIETDRDYTEREINAILKEWHTFGDWATLRRELFERGHINREIDGTRYWRTPNIKVY